MSDISKEKRLGTPVPFTCPECGGTLWELHTDQMRRYRCHAGHAFTAQALLEDQSEAIERTLLAALRALEERANMLMTIAKDAQENGHSVSASVHEKRAAESKDHAQRIRDLLVGEA